MKKIYGAIFSLIILIAGLGVWQIYKNSADPLVLTISAGPRGSDSFTLMREISEVLLRHSDTLRLRVRPSLNSSVNISRLHKNQAQLAIVESNTPAYNNVRLVANLFPDYFLLITQKSSRIYSVPDLTKHKVAIPEEGSSGSRSFWSVIDHYRVAPQSFRSFSITRSKAIEKFLTKKVDALFIVASLRDPFLLGFFEEARLRGIGIRFVPIEQANAMALKRPFLFSSDIVRGAFDGSGPLPLRDIKTASINRLLVARDDADHDAIKELVRVIFENRLDLLIRMPLSSYISGPDPNSGASLTVHDGAQAYYDRDKPSFFQENAEPIALVITIFAMVGSALLALRKSIGSSAKNRADVYNDRLLEIASRARGTKSRKKLVQLKDELTEVLEIVVHELDTDKVTEESFQSFAFLWKSTRDMITERQQDIA